MKLFLNLYSQTQWYALNLHSMQFLPIRNFQKNLQLTLFFRTFKLYLNPWIMPYDLLTYFERRVARSKKEKTGTVPFITISRQTGCNGNELAFQLIKKLRLLNADWKYTNKEVLEESAKKLKLDESKIKYVFDTEEKSHIDDILSAISNRYYKSDRAVR